MTRAPDRFRAWLGVAAISAALGIGAWALVRYLPPTEGSALGDRAPNYRVLDLTHDDSVGIRSAYAGHVTLVNIWATWCVPCQREMPSLERLYQLYRDRGLKIAAVSIDRADSGTVLHYTRALGLTFDILHDRSDGIEEAYQTIGTPETFVLDRSGRIRDFSLGDETWDSPANRARIERVLGRAD
ncbi:MAG TPA: TlpA disulfide reductase family protein [Gemmatimonadales bacterium]|jgi:thiol-disulfide isomerase/thioredoxin